MLNLSYVLETSAGRYPDQLAVIFNDRKMTYRELNGAATKFADGLRQLGVQPGDKVALMMPNVPYFPIAYYGILKAGAAVVPFNVLFKGREVAYHLQDSDAVAFVAFEMFVQSALEGFQEVPTCRNLIVATADPTGPLPVSGDGIKHFSHVLASGSPLFDSVQTTPNDTAVILYTSGTTGQPKGAELTHANMFLNAWISQQVATAQAGDVFLCTLPLFHSFGQTVVMNGSFLAGATLTLLPRFEPAAALGIMQRDGVTLFAGVPTMYWALLNFPGAADFDLEMIAGNLRVAVSGGSALPVEVLRGFEARYNVAILEGYGLSETSPVASFNHIDRERKVGSIGQPVWGTWMRIVDAEDKTLGPGETGEVVIRGHHVMKGYYKRPDATAQAIRNGWFHSGDLGRIDEDGYFYIVDRLKEMIIRGGFNVYPREVEEYLLTHPKISLCAVLGVPDARLGEEVKAYIVLKEGQQATVEEITAFAKAGLADYKYPRLIEFRTSLPMTATGKILKRELAES
jgi:long-chain acyl-CoA synthetase